MNRLTETLIKLATMLIGFGVLAIIIATSIRLLLFAVGILSMTGEQFLMNIILWAMGLLVAFIGDFTE